jgi:hypothetical protein
MWDAWAIKTDLLLDVKVIFLTFFMTYIANSVFCVYFKDFKEDVLFNTS